MGFFEKAAAIPEHASTEVSLLPALLVVPWCVSLPGRGLNKLGVPGRKLSCKLCTGRAPMGATGHSGPGALLDTEQSRWYEESIT